VYCDDYCPAPVPISVVSDPAGIDCQILGQVGEPSTKVCQANFLGGGGGTSVDLNATAGTTFSGDCSGVGSCTLLMDAPKNVTAER
jgi:hypothetical protein